MRKHLQERVNATRARLRKIAHVLHRTHAPAHATYFGLVAWEAGKWYGAVAAGLLVLTLIGWAAGEED